VADLIQLQADGLVGPDQRFHIDACRTCALLNSWTLLLTAMIVSSLCSWGLC
jgi:hypothetical protein